MEASARPASSTIPADAEVLRRLGAKSIAMVILTVDEKRSSIVASRPLRVAALNGGAVFYSTIAGAEAAGEALRHAVSFDLYSLQ